MFHQVLQYIWCYLMLSANVNLPLWTAQATFHPPVLFSFFAAKAATVVLTVIAGPLKLTTPSAAAAELVPSDE
jgi:hypothetical protein